MKVQKTSELESKPKKITAINIACRDFRIVGIGLNLFGIRLTMGFVLHDACEPDEADNVKGVAVDPPCRDCDIYEGMFW
jgi:hypothetical protein